MHAKAEFKPFVMFIQDQPEHLQSLADTCKSDLVSLCLLKGPQDPAIGLYKIKVDPAVRNTVLVYRDRKVTARFVNFSARRDGDKLHEAIEKACAD